MWQISIFIFFTFILSCFFVHNEELIKGTELARLHNIEIDRSWGCQLDPTLVSIRLKSNLLQYPVWTRAQRCKGLCASLSVFCRPTRTRILTAYVELYTYENDVKVVKEILGVNVVEHTSCECACRLKKKDCNSRQHYVAGKCKCECKDDPGLRAEKNKCMMNSWKRWDDKSCSCKCKNYFRFCTTNSRFSYKECKCVKDLLVLDTDYGE